MYHVILIHYSEDGQSWHGTSYHADSIPDVLAIRSAYPLCLLVSVFLNNQFIPDQGS
jgi:hypothetical protein